MAQAEQQENRLLAVFLGGVAPKGNTELHDLVFIAAPSLVQSYDALLSAWCGAPHGLHIDSWIALDVVGGHRVSLVPVGSSSSQTGGVLFFVNLGRYQAGIFGELHHNVFLVAASASEAKARAKAQVASQTGVAVAELHTDSLFEIGPRICDGNGAGGWQICLTPTDEAETLQIHNGYHPIP